MKLRISGYYFSAAFRGEYGGIRNSDCETGQYVAGSIRLPKGMGYLCFSYVFGV
jgi:hypothetical protein